MCTMCTIKTMQRTSIIWSIRRISALYSIETISGISKNVYKKLILHEVSVLCEVLEVSRVLVLYAIKELSIL